MKKIIALLLVAMMLFSAIGLAACKSEGTPGTTAAPGTGTTAPATGTTVPGTGTTSAPGTGTTETTPAPGGTDADLPWDNAEDDYSSGLSFVDPVLLGQSAFTNHWGSFQFTEKGAGFELIFLVDSDSTANLPNKTGAWIIRFPGHNYNYIVDSDYYVTVPQLGVKGDENGVGAKVAIALCYEHATTNDPTLFVPVIGETYDIKLAFVQRARATTAISMIEEEEPWYSFTLTGAAGNSGCGKTTAGDVVRENAWVPCEAYAPSEFEDHHVGLGLTLLCNNVDPTLFYQIKDYAKEYCFRFRVVDNNAPTRTRTITASSFKDIGDGSNLFYDAGDGSWHLIRVEIIPLKVLEVIKKQVEYNYGTSEMTFPSNADGSFVEYSADGKTTVKTWPGPNGLQDYVSNLKLDREGNATATAPGYFYPVYGSNYTIYVEVLDAAATETYYEFSPLLVPSCKYPSSLIRAEARRLDIEAGNKFEAYTGTITYASSAFGSGSTAPTYGGTGGAENPAKLFDKTKTTKFCVTNPPTDGELRIYFTTATAVTVYAVSILSANDNASYENRYAKTLSLHYTTTGTGNWATNQGNSISGIYNRNDQGDDGKVNYKEYYYKATNNTTAASSYCLVLGGLAGGHVQYADVYLWVKTA